MISFGRRGFLAAFLSATGLWFAAPWTRPIQNPQRVLAILLRDPNRARVVGLRYLETLPPSAANPQRLLRAVVGERHGINADDLKSVVQSRIRRDFTDGAMIRVDGWLLSETETRLYALAALTV